MNTKRLVHAPDGAMIPGSLCEGEGDTTTHFGDVTCPDCLDAYDVHPRNWAWLTRTTNQIRGGAPVMRPVCDHCDHEYPQPGYQGYCSQSCLEEQQGTMERRTQRSQERRRRRSKVAR